MPVRKIVKIIDEARRDSALARQSSSDPAFQRSVRKDRRGALSKFATVRSALKDRERIEKAKKKKKS